MTELGGAVSPIGFGAMGLSGVYGEITPAAATMTLSAPYLAELDARFPSDTAAAGNFR